MTRLELPLIVEPALLARHLGAPGLRIVDLSSPAVYAAQHVPGAVHIDFGRVTDARPPVMGLLPPVDALSRLLSEAGITPETHVVAYDAETGHKACRFLWTLDVIGHSRFSFLDGGLQAWLAAGQRVEQETPTIAPTQYPVTYGDAHKADKGYIRSHLGDSSVVVLDARTPPEYHGVDRRAARAGHIPGAVNVDWSRAVRGGGDLRLRPAAELRQLYQQAGVTPDKEVIVHCHTHQRSSHTYIALKSLGYERIKGYPGSWSDWGNDPETPIEQ